MTKFKFTKRDFDVFKIDGLENRMEELIEVTRPKLENLGKELAPYLSELTGEEHFVHVAKHARRTVHPPDDTWVAFSTNKRGYKMLPNFQIGLFKDHAFVQYGIIYEAPGKKDASKVWKKQVNDIEALGKDYFITLDHMKPDKMMIDEISNTEINKGLDRLANVKKGEFLIGKVYYPGSEALLTDMNFLEDIKDTFKTLSKFYINE
ncbi:YktB family protein [Phocicoccus pinnipedialis]|uniref:UPF0637 protein JEOPIN946_01434 n=1 Tax=Phocicoccus pinnipedialis TaxID=110845 RepID=A0A6V7RH53_9BACL|nr:DUF1054 domain-containing protein [Jeotgalicoccus pinnipedialis]MBP1939004.1 uncharacterized protein YktB (UPF0637 family) [Jeotgalicoccus pinnipedialis]CAD2077218.1 hypothetical protein JEOPIN946_01434 [Jeotgalicoccus pinnipedialis]